MNEILSGIKVIKLNYKKKTLKYRQKKRNKILSKKVLKFYGWELSFRGIVNKVRTTEMDYYKKIGLLSIFSNFLWACAPLLITIISFGCFIAFNDSEKFTSNVVFVSLSLFNILRFPLVVLPNIISAMIAVIINYEIMRILFKIK